MVGRIDNDAVAGVRLMLDRARLLQAADLLVEAAEEWPPSRSLAGLPDRAFATLLDSFASRYAPVLDRLQKLLTERGWTGWTHPERTSS